MNHSLMTMTYADSSKNVYLKTYADTVVYDNVNGKKKLCAIRFGGYPEQVDGMTQAIYGGGEIEVGVGQETITLTPLLKQYRRQMSHDGVYAEAVLIAEDENQQAKEQKQEKNKKGDDEFEEQIELDLPPRHSFIYVPPNDDKALYNAIDRKTGVPMIPEFSDYIISELKAKKILVPLTTLASSQKFDAWVLYCSSGDVNIAKVVEKGVKSGKITIPNATDRNSGAALNEINSVTEYLNTYGAAVAERIKKLFVPLFDPEKDELSPAIVEINETIQEKAGYPLYDAQLAVAEAIKRQLDRRKVGLIVAECGAGKTKIGTAAIAATVAGLQADQERRKKTKTFNIVLCPSHIKEKWVREIEETLPNTFAGIVNNITEFDTLYRGYEKGSKNCYAIISKEMARDGYMHMPTVKWSSSKKGFICPDCGEVVQMPISMDGARYIVDADQFFFKKQISDNHKCSNENCQRPLWTAVNPSVRRRSQWVKISDYGFVYASQAIHHLHKVKNASFEEKLYNILEQPESISTAVGAHRKYPLSSYIKKKYKGRIDGFIVDELHQYNNDSGQGDAMAELFEASKKVVGMTGTLINGYSSGIFYLLYRIVPKLMIEDDKPYNNPSSFIAEYGVSENTYETVEADYNANRRSVKKKKGSKQLPGVSPLVYARFLLEYAAFLSLSDMGKDLPEYEEIPVPIHLPDEVADEYFPMQKTLVSFMKDNKKVAKKILSAYLNLLTAYPDQPYDQPSILHPIEGYPIIEPENLFDFDILRSKDKGILLSEDEDGLSQEGEDVLSSEDERTPQQKLLPKDIKTLEIVKRKIEAGERVLIYTNWTRLDTQKKLSKLLTDMGYYTEILPSKVKPEKREKWVEERVRKGVQVLITNPRLVETGLDLIDFTTLIFYDVGYSLFTLRQASRRSWRINQTFPRIEVYMLYYQNTMQHKAIKLMASKLAVAAIIEGGYSEEGLAAMYQCDDMTSQMAKELMLGIKDSVEDVSSAFKRMAFLKKKDSGDQKVSVLFTDKPIVIKSNVKVNAPTVEFTFAPSAPKIPEPVITPKALDMQIPVSQIPKKTKNIKRYEANENQLSLFDLLFTA